MTNYLRLRIASLITVICGAIIAAAGLLDSLMTFGIGTSIAATGVLAHGLATHLQDHHDAELRQERDHVWARRDQAGL